MRGLDEELILIFDLLVQSGSMNGGEGIEASCSIIVHLGVEYKIYRPWLEYTNIRDLA